MPTIDMSEQLKTIIAKALPDAEVSVKMNGDRHYALAVKSSTFAGKPMLQCHRAVLSVIAPLMDGDDAQVHAIDSLKTSA